MIKMILYLDDNKFYVHVLDLTFLHLLFATKAIKQYFRDLVWLKVFASNPSATIINIGCHSATCQDYL